MPTHPIRWDNVNSPSYSDASQTLGAATQTLNNAFAPLRDSLASREALDAANWQNQKANNTTAYLDAVASARNLDDLKAQQGNLDNLRKSFGYQVDANAIRGALDQRTAFLRGDALQNIAYDHAMKDEATAGIADAFKTAALKGDHAAMTRLASDYEAKSGRDLASLTQFGVNRDRQVVEQGQADQSHSKNMDRISAEIQRWKDSTQIDRGQLAVAQTNAKTQQDSVAVQRSNMLMNFVDHIDAGILKNQQAKTGLLNVTASSDAGQAMIDKAVAGLKDESARRNAAQAASEFTQANPNAPAGAVATGISSIDQRAWRGDDTIRGEVQNVMAGLAKAGKSDENSQAKREARDAYQENIDRLQATRDVTQRQAYAALFPNAAPALPGDAKSAATVASPFDMPVPAAARTATPAAATTTTGAAPAAATPAVAYRPSTVAPPAAVDPLVQKAQTTLAKLQAKPPQDLSVNERLDMRNAQLVLADAAKQALVDAAKQARQAAPEPQYDPAMISRMVEQAAAGGIMPAGFRR